MRAVVALLVKSLAKDPQFKGLNPSAATVLWVKKPKCLNLKNFHSRVNPAKLFCKFSKLL
jgi:hypothetical protein